MANHIGIRPLSAASEYAACVALQERVWGPGDETIPSIMLLVSQKIGGIAAGAFDAKGRLLGCVFGLTGLRHGRLAHWSHMLAVRPGARDRGIGRRLKLYQRRRLLAAGVPTMYWSFDPLVARNAHLNLRRLGAVVEDYVADMYGPGSGTMDRVIGTDRMIVRWDLRQHPPRKRTIPRTPAPSVNPVSSPRRESGAAPLPLPPSPAVRVEIPSDIHALRDRHPTQARAWRLTSRRAFQHYLRRGYRVVDFQAGGGAARGSYLLVRDS